MAPPTYGRDRCGGTALVWLVVIEKGVDEKDASWRVRAIVPYGFKIAGQPILKLGFPKDSLITLVGRDKQFLMPCGDTVLEEADVLLVLADRNSLPAVRAILEQR